MIVADNDESRVCVHTHKGEHALYDRNIGAFLIILAKLHHREVRLRAQRLCQLPHAVGQLVVMGICENYQILVDLFLF